MSLIDCRVIIRIEGGEPIDVADILIDSDGVLLDFRPWTLDHANIAQLSALSILHHALKREVGWNHDGTEDQP